MVRGIMIEEEKIEVVKTWPEPQSVRDIQVFLGFVNFYRRFIRNFNRIAAPLTSMLQTTDDKALKTQVIGNKKNQKVLNGTIKAGCHGVDGVNGSIENLSSGIKVKRSFKADFFTSGAKKVFIHL